MRLRDILKCVQISKSKYKNYQQRNQLPFFSQEEFSVPPGEKLHSRWTDFSLEDALRLQVMVDLSDYSWPKNEASPDGHGSYEGLPPMSASSIASNGVGETMAKYGLLEGIRAQDTDIWHVAMIKSLDYKGDLCYGMERFSGTLVECAEKIEEQKEGQVRAIIFNVSQALERMLTAGEAQAVQEAVFFLDAENA